MRLSVSKNLRRIRLPCCVDPHYQLPTNLLAQLAAGAALVGATVSQRNTRNGSVENLTFIPNP